MAERKLYLGDRGPYLFDDDVLISDPDGDFVGLNQVAAISDGNIVAAEFHGVPVSNLVVANIDDPSTELNAIDASTIGALVACYQVVGAAPDVFTLYLWDTAGGAENVPYTVDGLTGIWVAVAGRYIASDFGVGGKLTLSGSGRVIKEVSFPLFQVGAGATAPTLVRFGNAFGYAFAILDDGYLQLEVPSDYDDTSGITIFLRTAINETYALQNAEVRWQGTYSCVPDDESEAITGATHTGTLDSGDVNIPAIARGLQEVTLGTIPAADLALNDVIFILISRIALVGGVNPTAVPVVIQAGYEYRSNKLGEAI
jgi:hypothetical protein